MLVIAFEWKLDSYSKIERVATNDLMRMRGWSLTWTYEWVGPLDGQLRACKTKHVLCKDMVRHQRVDGK